MAGHAGAICRSGGYGGSDKASSLWPDAATCESPGPVRGVFPGVGPADQHSRTARALRGDPADALSTAGVHSDVAAGRLSAGAIGFAEAGLAMGAPVRSALR